MTTVDPREVMAVIERRDRVLRDRNDARAKFAEARRVFEETEAKLDRELQDANVALHEALGKPEPTTVLRQTMQGLEKLSGPKTSA